jgi:hypothetical protein
VDDCWRTVYPDRDGDGFGDTALAEESCSARVGYVTVGGDCDEDDPSVHPGAAEACNGVDDDCDDVVDEDTRYVDHLPDLDADGYGDPLGTPINACAPIPGYAPNAEDCADDDASVHPGATEVCNGQDDDCDDDIDDADADLDTTAQSTFYLDADVDGFGDSGALVDACAAPPRYSPLWGDCDDGDALVHPAATEVCNGVDDDCDSRVDDADASLDPATRSDWYTDNDRDGHGAGAARLACAAPAGTVGSGADCDDTTALAHPGAAERCDGIDNDCDGLTRRRLTPTVDPEQPTPPTTPTCRWRRLRRSGHRGRQVCDPIAPGVHRADGRLRRRRPSPSTPAAAEVCDGRRRRLRRRWSTTSTDSVDVGAATDWYPDADGDLLRRRRGPLDPRLRRPRRRGPGAQPPGDCDDSLAGSPTPGPPR